MSIDATDSKSRSRNPLPSILIGGILAPVVLLLFSFISSAPAMREMPVMFSVPVLGALIGYAIYALNPFGRRPRGWKKPVLVFVAILVYSMAVIFGFLVNRLGSF